MPGPVNVKLSNSEFILPRTYVIRTNKMHTLYINILI